MVGVWIWVSGNAIHIEFIDVFSGLLFLVFGEQVILWCVFPCEVNGGFFIGIFFIGGIYVYF